MNNNINDYKEVENDSTSLNDYEMEVETPEKKGFFANIIDKIKRNNSTKLLESGNKDTFQKTNRSISSMWTIGSLRRIVMERLESFNRALFGSQENIDQSNITTHVIGRDEVKKDDLSQEAIKTTFEPVIPIAKSVAARTTKIVPEPVKTGIINNEKSSKDVKEEIAENQGIQVEEVEVSDEFIQINEKEQLNIDNLTAGDIINRASRNINLIVSSIEIGEIKIGQDKPKERNDNDDRDL